MQHVACLHTIPVWCISVEKQLRWKVWLGEGMYIIDGLKALNVVSVHIITLSHEESITGKKRGRQQRICEWHGVKSFMRDMTVRRHDVCSMQVNNWCLEYIWTKIELRRDFFVGIDFGFMPWDISLCIVTTNAQLYVLNKFYQFMKMSKHLKHYSDCILNMFITSTYRNSCLCDAFKIIYTPF